MTLTFPKTRPPQRQSKMSYTRQSLWLRSPLHGRRNTLVKEHILPTLQTAATASSTKIHRLHYHFGHPSAKKLYRVLKHSRLARNSNSATTIAISTKAVPVEVYWSIGLVKQAHPALWSLPKNKQPRPFYLVHYRSSSAIQKAMADIVKL